MNVNRTKIFDVARLVVLGIVVVWLLSSITYQPPPDRIKDMFYSSVYDYGSGHIIDNQKLRVGGWGDE